MPKSKEKENPDELVLEESSGNIFSDLGYSEDEAASMQACGQLAMEIRRIIEAKGWSWREAARNMGIAQPLIATIFRRQP